MNATCGCSRKAKRSAFRNGAGWVIPGLFLILLPKCPLCLAAAFSVIFGIGLSADAAGVLQGCAILLCVMAVAIFAVRQAGPWFQRHVSSAKFKTRRRTTIKL